jgi:hypothetical protein
MFNVNGVSPELTLVEYDRENDAFHYACNTKVHCSRLINSQQTVTVIGLHVWVSYRGCDITAMLAEPKLIYPDKGFTQGIGRLLGFTSPLDYTERGMQYEGFVSMEA